MIVPGMSAGLAWRATEGLPLLGRLTWGIAIGLAVYAAIVLAVWVFRSRDRH
jgi:hypothetical protein